MSLLSSLEIVPSVPRARVPRNGCFCRGSMYGTIDNATTARAVDRLQITAVILHRWHAKSPEEVAAWLEREPRMKPLGDLVKDVQTP